MNDRLLTFAVVGHPNEGKSSVVATLVEDDAIRISPTPGETRQARDYPVSVGESTRISFLDTPGFQSPETLLGLAEEAGGDWLETVGLQPGFPDRFPDEWEIVNAIGRADGLLYVVDASRPARKADLAEMELLRRTGVPRMAILNAKTDPEWLDDWKDALRKTFNSIRIFSAHEAGFRERLRLFEALRSMDPDMEPLLDGAVQDLREDWDRRISTTAARISDLVVAVSRLSLSRNALEPHEVESVTGDLIEEWKERIYKRELACWKELQRIFRHNRFRPEPPPASLTGTEAVSEESFRLFGLSRMQLAAIGGGAGALVGAKVDALTGGASLGAITAASGVIGAAWSYVGLRKVDVRKVAGVKISGVSVKVGPVADERLSWVILDRAISVYLLLVTRAHAIQDDDRGLPTRQAARFDKATRKVLAGFFRKSVSGRIPEAMRKEVEASLRTELVRLATEGR